MNTAVGIRRSPPGLAALAGPAAMVLPLAAVGYLIFSDVRMAAALAGVRMLGAWFVVAYRHPRRAIVLSVIFLLVAGTKFRLREADASLEGSVDAQILFELATFGVIAVGAFAAFAASMLSSPTRFRLRGVELLLAAYVPVTLVSVFWSQAPALTLVRGMQLLIIGMLAMAAVRILGPLTSLRTSSIATGIYAMCCAALALTMPWAAAAYESRENRFRFTWFAVHPIEVGTITALAALGLFGMLLWRSSAPNRVGTGFGYVGAGFSRPWYYLVAVCAVVVLIFTNSRGPLLAFAAGLAVLAFFRLPARFRPAIVTLGSIPVIVAVAAGSEMLEWLFQLVERDDTLGRFLLQGQTADDLIGMNGRTELWNAVRPELAAHGVFGYGYQASRSVLLDSAYWTPAYAHNALLQSLLDLGLVGTILLTAIVVAALTSLFRVRLEPRVRATTAALTVFLVLNSISTESFAGAPGIDAFALCLCALCATVPSPRVTRGDSG